MSNTKGGTNVPPFAFEVAQGFTPCIFSSAFHFIVIPSGLQPARNLLFLDATESGMSDRTPKNTTGEDYCPRPPRNSKTLPTVMLRVLVQKRLPLVRQVVRCEDR